MDRKTFLKGAGLAGIASLLPLSKTQANSEIQTPIKAVDEANKCAESICVLIPSETAGPFPLDLTANTVFFRKDIHETKTGVPLNVKIKVMGVGNCQPMSNLRVNIWHCDKDGLYSGYSQSNNQGQAGLTYLRGYQMTNANGEAEFITIFPGWYNGRIAHIHFQVYVSSSYSAVSQMTFDIPTKNAIYAANPSLYTKGADPMTFATDNIFSDGYAYQIATLTKNTTTGGYDAYLEVSIQGNGTTDIGHLEKENAKQFTLGQNYPNPYSSETTIPFTLQTPSNVKIEIWDLSGKKVGEIAQNELNVGEHSVLFNPAKMNLATGHYIYQIEIVNNNGTFRQTKMMTAFEE